MLYCCVAGCYSNQKTNPELSFHHFPKANERFNEGFQALLQRRRELWFRALKLKNPTGALRSSDRICSLHFLSGGPSDFRQIDHVDWIPSRNICPVSTTCSVTPSKADTFASYPKEVKRRKLFNDSNLATEETSIQESDEGNVFDHEFSPQKESYRDMSTQTDITYEYITQLELENVNLRKELKYKSLQQESFENGNGDTNDRKIEYYTGLPNILSFMIMIDHISDFLNEIRVPNLTNFQKVLLVLMKSRLNLDFTDLSYRFDVRVSTISSIFKRVLICLTNSFDYLVHWPERDALRAQMPACFQAKFGNRVSVIVDCFEVPTQKPSLIKAKVQAYSSYKSRITIKYLLGVTPHGYISFISEGWGGRTSDQHVTNACGILDNLLPGDIILADRGFTIQEMVGMRHASLGIPSFTKGKKQLHPIEVKNTRKIASVRIHVERVIGSIRKKYKILNSPVPVSFLNEMHENKAMMDYVVRVACILVNLCPAIVND